jgi:two-component system, OmpR family, sensor histidine kinase KdpD
MQQRSLQLHSVQLLSMLALLAITTAINYSLFSALGITGVTLLYLLVVVTAAYFCEFIVASFTAFLAFLVINYFFIEPRYTFEVAHIESWVSLVCFLIVSMVVTSLVKELKFQTLQYSLATKRAKFARNLAENLALATEMSQLLRDSCTLLRAEFDKPIGIAQLDNSNLSYQLTTISDLTDQPNHSLLKWVSENGKPISPYTNYWSKSTYWLIPFNHLPSKDPILIIGNINNEDIQQDDIETYTTIKSCVNQISQAYQRLSNSEKVKHAELLAQSEAIQSALLASISHDMRTPLTSILGAATTLQQADLAPEQATHLSALIASQARYLASTTENILSLIRLESTAVEQIPMDWQSPEEIIGVVNTLYKSQSEYHSQSELVDLQVTMSEPELLIKANANLLTQALINLIDNAKQAQLGLYLNQEPILIDVTKADERINISVSDRGIGFSETFNVSQIKKFSSSNTKGFGLGLSIVQAIAKAHDATFTINNRDGGGACVTLSFHIPDVANVDVGNTSA